MSFDERPWSSVPSWLGATFALLLAAQIAWHAGRAPARDDVRFDLPPAPRAATLRLAAFGEDAVVARLAMLYLQSFDSRGGNAIPYQRLDYGRLTAWLSTILETDPRSAYPLFSAARVYAEIPDP
ncbi:MAG: hypothetical protein P8Y76_02535, partial [bacterium]